MSVVQVSGVLTYVAYLLSLYLSVNSSVWVLAPCTRARVSVCENVAVCLRSINQAFC